MKQLLPVHEFLKNRLSPFQHQGFRLFFGAQIISLIGTWAHELARAWLVLELYGTAAALGTLLLSISLPGLFFTLHGGVIADRVDVRRFMFFTKAILATSAFAFFILTEYFHVTIWIIVAFGLLEGIINSYDSPSFTVLFTRTVPRSDLQQALALQSTNFHTARMLGPLAAGILMAWHGPSLVFLFDSLSYLGLLFVLKKIELRPIRKNPNADTTKRFGALLEGIKYFFTTPSIRYKQLQLLLTLSIMLPIFTVVLRTFFKAKFDLSAGEFGYLFAFPSIGSMVGAVYFILAKLKNPMRNLTFAIPGMITCSILINFVPTIQAAAATMTLLGLFSYLSVASLTQSLHLEIDEQFRGRLGSLIGLGFMTISPLMSFPLGLYTDHMGFTRAIIDPTLLFAFLSVILFSLHKRELSRPKSSCTN